MNHPQMNIVSGISLNLPQMLKVKQQLVVGLTKGIETLFKQNKVNYIKNAAFFACPIQVTIQLLKGGEMEIKAKNFIIATDSKVTPFSGGGIHIDKKQMILLTGVLELQEVLNKMVVIGGGIISLEMGSV